MNLDYHDKLAEGKTENQDVSSALPPRHPDFRNPSLGNYKKHLDKNNGGYL
jgi:hypothetical protein